MSDTDLEKFDKFTTALVAEAFGIPEHLLRGEPNPRGKNTMTDLLMDKLIDRLLQANTESERHRKETIAENAARRAAEERGHNLARVVNDQESKIQQAMQEVSVLKAIVAQRNRESREATPRLQELHNATMDFLTLTATGQKPRLKEVQAARARVAKAAHAAHDDCGFIPF